MSFGISACTLAVGGLLLASMMQQKPSTPAPPTPAPPPQASRTPDSAGVLAGMQGAGQAGGSPGVAQTFLSGINGVDPNQLLLGRNTLLGA